MANSERRLTLRFLADVRQFLSSMQEAEDGLSETERAAERAREALGDVGDGTRASSEEADRAMRRLGITSERQAQQRIQSLESEVETVRAAYRAGEATAGDLQRAQERLTQQQERWARLTRTSVEENVETPLRRVERLARRVGDRFSSMGQRVSKFSAGAGALLGGGLFAATQEVERGQQVRIGTLAAGLDPTSDEDLLQFQRLAAAANVSLGFEVDKTGDLLKDVNEKFGEFVETGGGPIAEFFELFGVRAGIVDAQKLRAAKSEDAEEGALESLLSSSGRAFMGDKNSIELIQSYVDALYQAGATSDQITRYMEAIASDSTLYYNVLKDSGAELERIADIAESTGAIFSADDIATLQKAREEMGLMRLAFSGIVLTLADAGFFEAFAKFAGKVSEIAVWIAEKISPEFLIWTTAILAFVAALAPVLFTVSSIFGVVAAIAAKLAIFGPALAAFGGTLLAGVAAIGAIPLAIGLAITAIVFYFRDEITSILTWVFDKFLGMLKSVGGWFKSGWDWVTGGGEPNGFREGGYTGNGPVNGVAGVVHGREWVVDARATSFWGTDFLGMINDMVMPPSFGGVPPALVEAGNPSHAGMLNFDAMVDGQAMPMMTDPETYDRMNGILARRRMTATTQSPRFTRGRRR